MVRGQPKKIVHETPSKITRAKKNNNNQSKMDWRCASSGIAPIIQA
jgi:hypothetical protein